jgi:hypothetical protein
MSVSLPNGALIAIQSAIAAAVVVTAVSNASEAQVTAAGHGYSNGDIVVMYSGWSRANAKPFRVKTAASNTFVLEGFDTTDTDLFPAGSGTGTVKKVTTFTQVQQILSSQTNGGEQQFLEYQFLEADAQTRLPTFKNAFGLTLSIADDPTLAGYIAAKAANDDREVRAVRVSLPNGSKIYYNGYVSVNETPSLTVNELMAVEMTLSMTNTPTRYAS